MKKHHDCEHLDVGSQWSFFSRLLLVTNPDRIYNRQPEMKKQALHNNGKTLRLQIPERLTSPQWTNVGSCVEERERGRFLFSAISVVMYLKSLRNVFWCKFCCCHNFWFPSFVSGSAKTDKELSSTCSVKPNFVSWQSCLTSMQK